MTEYERKLLGNMFRKKFKSSDKRKEVKPMQTFEECMKESHLEITFDEPITDERVAKLLYAHDKICGQLSDYSNFDGIDFCDVGAGGIQIRGHHKQVEKYCFGEQVTIKYDFSNLTEAINEFIAMWKAHDNDEAIHDYLEFIHWGEKFGWD